MGEVRQQLQNDDCFIELLMIAEFSLLSRRTMLTLNAWQSQWTKERKETKC